MKAGLALSMAGVSRLHNPGTNEAPCEPDVWSLRPRCVTSGGRAGPKARAAGRGEEYRNGPQGVHIGSTFAPQVVVRKPSMLWVAVPLDHQMLWFWA